MELNGISNKSVSNSLNENDNTAKDILGKDDFLNLLVTQLKNQDPLNPMEDKEFIAQTAQFSSLEQMQNLNSSVENGFENLMNLQGQMLMLANVNSLMNNAFNVVGKEITGVNSEGDTVTGLVEKVKVVSGLPIAIVGENEIAMEDILEIILPQSTDEVESSIEGENNEG